MDRGEITMDRWESCYDQGWQDSLVPEAFSHPAKFARGLIHRIYQHAKEMGWVSAGDYVLDPFGGVGLGGLDAMSMGLNWIGVELEEKFVKLGQENIALWKRQLKGWPNLGSAIIVQGDSRRLREVIAGANLIVSSPPYAESDCSASHVQGYSRLDPKSKNYRPFAVRSIKEGYNNPRPYHAGADLVVSSPPYACDQMGGGGNKHDKVIDAMKDGYGKSPGQLGSMAEGKFDCVVSSPPYESHNQYEHECVKPLSHYKKTGGPWKEYHVAESEGQLGNSSGDTFWAASREIVQQCYDLLRPGGHAIWVCKDYVKNKKRVPFSDRWLAICESVGFKLICRHAAMLVKSFGVQECINGECEEVTVERKSFFRRLAESKGSPRIDHEDVMCLEI